MTIENLKSRQETLNDNLAKLLLETTELVNIIVGDIVNQKERDPYPIMSGGLIADIFNSQCDTGDYVDKIHENIKILQSHTYDINNKTPVQ